MNGSKESIAELMQQLKTGVGGLDAVTTIVFPPYVYLPMLSEPSAAWGSIKIGAQDVSIHPNGAYTGEISSQMLSDFYCEYVLVGHSERRQYFSESNALVAEKFKRVQQHGMTPVLCVGETLEQRRAGEAQNVIANQIDAVISHQGLSIDALANAIIAYEPVWAIGTGETASPQQAQEIHATIRDQLQQHSKDIAMRTPILYGGSVKASNAGALFAMPDIDGGLVGGASLDAQQFVEICQCTKSS